ncbi:MAG: phosphotransferase family protein [Actinomycetia bacterium]|nr:phosphotransferase family protein [Actinomycetes bacterium]
MHGDYRLGNLVPDPDTQQVRAVLDWEMSTFGDPVMDLALLLVYSAGLGGATPALLDLGLAVADGHGLAGLTA